jgi:gluconate 5-dehydrogenase
VAVVTGAARGIGCALAWALGHAGASLALLGRDLAAVCARAREMTEAGLVANGYAADVEDARGTEAALEQVLADRGRLDILINNAGVEQLCPSLDVTAALWDRIIGTNLKGAFFTAQAAARRMGEGASIINICSLTSQVGVPGAAPYGASKAGLVGLTHALAAEWAGRGIRVNGIGPGYFRTALTEAFYQDAAWRSTMLAKIPLRRFGQLEDLGGAAVFLCSPAAAYITGQVLYVDGGILAAL